MRARGIYRPRGGMLLPSYIGPVGTRCRLMQNVAANPSTYGFCKRTYHYARDNITWVRIGVPDWYCSFAAGEAGGGSGWTFAASLEYPFTVSTVGTTCKVGTWSGATTSTAVAGTTMWSDWMYFPVPAGAKFGSRVWVDITAGGGVQQTPYNDPTTYGGAWIDATGGDVMDFSGTNFVAGGTMTHDAAQIDFTPILIGPTRRPTVAIMGDSRQSGWLDTVDTDAGDAGETARTYGKYFNYLNLAVGGDTLASFIASNGSASPLRRGLAAYCSHVSMNMGINDLSAGGSAATAEANIRTIMGLPGIVGKPAVYDLMLPLATSTDGFATTGNQTTEASNANRNTVNAFIATGAVGGVNDPRGPSEFPTIPSGIWNAPGFTTDGTHPTVADYQDIMNGGWVDPRKIKRRR